MVLVCVAFSFPVRHSELAKKEVIYLARQNYGFEKRQKEVAKQKKKAEKRKRKLEKKGPAKDSQHEPSDSQPGHEGE